MWPWKYSSQRIRLVRIDMRETIDAGEMLIQERLDHRLIAAMGRGD
jgi:hypothetical protein